MSILRIVPNLHCEAPGELAAFYADLFGLEIAMDQSWIVTLGGAGPQQTQLTLAREGGSGTELPALSIEVDDLDQVLARAGAMGVVPEYGPVTEPWGVRRFYVRDPGGTLLNVLSHVD